MPGSKEAIMRQSQRQNLARRSVAWMHRSKFRRGAVVLLAGVAAACFVPCRAQGQQGQQVQQGLQEQPPPRDPQYNLAVMMVRNAVTAVNHGNLTGNYTVLRDLGGPAFRERNSAAQLAIIFQRLREQKTDLSPVLVLEPQFSEPPRINASGQLELVGSFPSQPLRVHFRLAFQQVPGGWAIDAVSIGTAVPQLSQNTAALGYPAPPYGAADTANRSPNGYAR
jgi:hypothetical protein